MKNSKACRVCVRSIALSLLIFTSSQVFAQIQFQDVTDAAGGFAKGERWGAAWGDINGDRRPDIFVNNHRGTPASMWINNGDGTFYDAIWQLDRNRELLDDPKQDAHGATFVDFDNDGDQDLFASHSSNKDGRLFTNNNGVFTDQASNSDLTNDGTSRNPAWFDYNGDGFLDNFFMTFNSIRINVHDPDGSGGFIGDFDSVSTSSLGVSCSNDNYAQFIDVNGDDELDFICAREGLFPQKVYDMNTSSFAGSFTDITSLIPSVGNVVDTALGDFDRNLKMDIFATRGRMRPFEALQVADNKIESWISAGSNGEQGFKFQQNGQGEITVTIDSKYSDILNRIRIGSSGFNPSAIPFTIDSANTSTHGLNSSTSWGVYIGFNPSIGPDGEWELRFRTDTSRRGYFQIETENDVTDLEMFGLRTVDQPISSKLLMNTSAGFQEMAQSKGLGGNRQCVSAVSGDFDNDMDEDLYLVCRGGVSNIANILFENQGDGSFVEVANAAGAQGPIGAGLASGVGTGESVITADYDNDGFLDLFVTNGLLMQPTREGGPDKLYRNQSREQGNNNHWVEFDLVGSASSAPTSGDNRDAIGAKVFVTAGNITQLREQGHGYHRWSQNHKRIHFGLASYDTFDVEVRWPNGLTDNFTAVSSDSIYEISQGASNNSGTITAVSAGQPNFPAAPVAGDQCGQPSYNANFDKAVFVWKNCSNNQWEIRVMAGGSPSNLVFEGNVSTNSGAFTNVTGIGLQSNDDLDFSDPALIDFSFNVANAGQDAFTFNAPGGSTTQACLQMTQLPQGAAILLGGDLVRLGESADLGTFQVCDGPPQQSAECGEPNYNPANIADRGTFIWKDCAITGTESWHVRTTSGGSTATIAYEGSVSSDEDFLTLTDFNLERPWDILEMDDPMQINYLLKMKNSGQDGFDFTYNSSAEVCIDPGALPAGASVYLGSGRQDVTVTGAFRLDLVSTSGIVSCSPPTEPLECGQPNYNSGVDVDRALFIWKDCDAAEPTWHIRATAGGSPDKITYQGSVDTSGASFPGISPISIETNDVLDSVPNDDIIDFIFNMRNAGQDGADFTVLPGTTTCFDASLPAGAQQQVLLGSTRAPTSLPFCL